MSNFLGAESFLVPLGATTQQARDTIAAAFTSRGWQIVARGIARQALSATGCTTFTQANDGCVDTVTSAMTLPSTIVIQLQAAGILSKYELVGDPTTSWGNYCPSDWTVDYADNPAGPWTAADTQSNVIFNHQGEVKTFIIGGTPGAHIYWRLNVTKAMGSTATAYIAEWRPFLSTGEYITDREYLHLIPPSGETIGSAAGREVVIMSFTATTLGVQAGVQYLQDIPQVMTIWEKTAGAVTPSITASNGTWGAITASISGTTLTVTSTSVVLGIGSIVVGGGVVGNVPGSNVIIALGTGTGGNGTYTLGASYGTITSRTFYAQAITNTISGATGSAGSSAKDNLRSLYIALKNTADAFWSDWNWFYQKPSPQNADDTFDYIVGVRKTAVSANIYHLAALNPNINVGMAGNFALATVPFMDQVGGKIVPLANQQSMTTDLVNGFIYYLQVCSRGFAIATKTNVAYYGPLHACYADHAKALAVMPATFSPKFLLPSELVVGFDGASSTNTSTAFPAKFMGVGGKMGATPPNSWGSFASQQPLANTFRFRNQFCDWSNTYQNTPWAWTFNLYASGIFQAATELASDDFQIHRMAMAGVASMASPIGNNPVENYPSLITPMLDITDWYKFRGTATNESLALAADTVAVTTLNQAMDATTAYTTLALTATAGLAAAGFVIVEAEVIQYTGISGNNLTGVTRAKYGTAMQTHWTGDTVAQALWYTIINGGALLFGAVKPS